MAISTYAELQTAIPTWLDAGTDVTNNVADLIGLGEAWLNTNLPLSFQETDDATLTGSTSSRALTTPSRFLHPISLRLTTFGDVRELRPDIAGKMPLSTTNGTPSAWAMNGITAIQLDRPCDQAHTFTLRYRKKMAIATDSTNWLLTNFPGAYLYASLVEAATFSSDDDAAVKWQLRLDKIMGELRSLDAKNRSVAVLTVDPALLNVGGNAFDYTSGLPA